MEVVASILGSAVKEAGRLLWRSYPNIKNFIRFQSNFSVLEKEMENLLYLRNSVKYGVESSDAQMTQWLREVQQIILDLNTVRADMTANNKKLCGCFSKCSKRYGISRETTRMLKEVERLQKAGKIAADMMSQDYLPEAIEHIPGPSIENQTTASKNLAKVMDLLNDHNVLTIGVWGMGGVGKTTLVKNLNNKLKSSSTVQQFGMVIWATVSKKVDLKMVQIQIAERLNLKVNVGESMQRLAIRLHQRLEKENFLLILDDIWETIDLDCLGVPQPEDHRGSKIVLTSRSLEVCRGMKTDKEVKVDVLNDEESWKLFKRNAGKVATLEHIEPISREVARECSGLPLAIITMGTAMRGKMMIELWKDALRELQRSVPYIKGIENKVYKPLKWSYDSLQGKNIKPCFLYCCLYPEDYSIEISELVKCWVAEGLIDEHQNHEDSYNRGMALIENLKDSCLLEHGAREGTVKMHDVVRDVAVWISSSLENGEKSLIRSGIGLTQISEVGMSSSLKRISFMNNKIIELPECGIHCPEVSSLLLQGNLPLERIPDGFLQAFQSLSVLNVGGTRIKSLPESILLLGDLQVLLLKECFYLEELPQLGRLSKLQVLDCCATSIRELPSGMKNLSNLRQLDLSRTHNLKTIRHGIMSRLSSLEFLDMTLSAHLWKDKHEMSLDSFAWKVKQHEDDELATFEELKCLERLLFLSIRLQGIPFLDSEDLTWISRLRKFHFFIGPTAKTLPTKLEERSVRITDLELSQKQIVWFLINATSVLISGCWELNKLLENFIKDRVHCVSGLKSLTISSCVAGSRPRTFPHPLSMSGSQKKLPVAQCDLLPNLEELHLHHLMHLKSISELAGHLGLKFSRLRILEVTHCAQIDHVLPYGDSMINTEMLEVIKIGFCDNLEEIFRYVPGQREAPFSVLPNLHIVELKYLQSLKTICKQEDSLQSLEQLEVINCGALRTLPLTDHNANTIKEIKGGIFWWNNLEWDNYNTKVCVQHFFKPASGDIRPETWRWFRTDPNVNSWMPTTLPTIRQGPLQYI